MAGRETHGDHVSTRGFDNAKSIESINERRITCRIFLNRLKSPVTIPAILALIYFVVKNWIGFDIPGVGRVCHACDGCGSCVRHREQPDKQRRILVNEEPRRYSPGNVHEDRASAVMVGALFF